MYYAEGLQLIFKDELERGAWRPILFFPDNDTIEFTLYPMHMADNNQITGSQLSIEESKYNQVIREIYYGKYVYWNQKLDSLTNINETDSDYAIQAADSINGILNAIPQFELKYATNNANLYGYNKFLNILRNEKELRLFSRDTLKKYHEIFQQMYPNHPYNEISEYRLAGLINIKVGGSYVDFTASDSTGRKIIISNYIAQNKYTLLDLWAPWCGPCIKKSHQILPIYDQYKNSGFGVIGIVGGIGNHEHFLQAIKKYNYPWTVLSEINNQNDLWERYSISKSGGSQFLVDNVGKILAINPSPEELKKIILE
jgi:thiol-disulfide isomerase/thioredoxin